MDQRITQTEEQKASTIDYFVKAIETDPSFALAHAQLAYAYATNANFSQATDSELADKARAEIEHAQALDPELAEIALARYQLLSSRYENFQNAAAVRVLLAAQRLDPNVGYAELGYLYGHLGLPNLAERASRRALEIDPTSDFAKRMLLLAYESSAQHDQWFEAHERLFPNEPIESVNFLSAGRLDEARRALDRVATNNSAQFQVLPSRALLAALKGDVRAAEAAIPALLGRHVVKDPYYHHVAYIVACIYAIGGKSVEAMKWLREAVATGFAVYPLYERIGFLDRIRQTPDFVQFMAELKATTDRYHREFESR